MSYIPQPMTASQLVTELNIDRRKLGQVLIKCDVVKQSGKIKYYLVQDVVKHLYIKDNTVITIEEARKQKAIAEAELLQLNLEREKGNLLDRELIDKQWANLIMACKNKLNALPNKLAPMLAVESGIDVVKNMLSLNINEALTELSKGDEIEFVSNKQDKEHGTKSSTNVRTNRTINNK
jgi:hypothetical protein|tara:strand:+ start:197 stop:733 length:537 start_codon:yes stop_codon:yes gene_type:complete